MFGEVSIPYLHYVPSRPREYIPVIAVSTVQGCHEWLADHWRMDALILLVESAISVHVTILYMYTKWAYQVVYKVSVRDSRTRNIYISM